MPFVFKLTLWDLFMYINILLVLSVVFLEHKNATATWAWIMLMLFVPFIGFILYLLIGQDLRKRKTFNKKEEEDRFVALLHNQLSALNESLSHYCNPMLLTYQDLITLHLNAHEALYTEDNKVQLFTDGYQLFADLFAKIRNAQKSIHIEYYIFRDDPLGRRLQKLLIQKAQEGISIQIVYDDMGCFGHFPNFFREMRKAHIEVSCFFPSYIPFIKRRANYRNHRKIVVIDGQIAYLGGFNIGIEYLGLKKKFGYWRDTHMRLEGSCVQLIDLQFLLDRRFATHTNTTLIPNLDHFCLGIPVNCSNFVGMQIVSSGPDSKYANIYNGFITMIHNAKRSIYIQTPYFIPDEGITTALKLAALSGKDVRIMIPNRPDHLFVYWATYSHIGELLESGVRCFTYEHGFLHAKTIVVDDEICSIGSANFDIRSFKLDFEINAFIYDCNISKTMSDYFHKDLEFCNEITPELYAHRSFMIRIKESLSRLISPIL